MANAPGEGLAYNADHLDENGQPLPITHRSSTLLSDALSKAPESLKMTAISQRLLNPSGEQGSVMEKIIWVGYIIPGSGTHTTRRSSTLSLNGEAAGRHHPRQCDRWENTLEVLWLRRSQADERLFLSRPSVVGNLYLSVRALPTNSSSPAMPARKPVWPPREVRPTATCLSAGIQSQRRACSDAGGQSLALRDDLNVTSGENQSSEPYVLVDTPVPMVVRRWGVPGVAGEALRWVGLDYIVEAGTRLRCSCLRQQQPTATENGFEDEMLKNESSAEPNNGVSYWRIARPTIGWQQPHLRGQEAEQIRLLGVMRGLQCLRRDITTRVMGRGR